MQSGLKRKLKQTFVYDLYKHFQNVRHQAIAKKYHIENGNGFYCIGCRQYWSAFAPLPAKWFNILTENGWPYTLDQAETLNHTQYTCYGCGMTDRDRLYALYFSERFDKQAKLNVIEFAPTKPLSNFFRTYPQLILRTSDLFMDDVDDKLDIQNLSKYSDGQFDFFVCSHILEHVPDDRKAMSELFRITKPGGSGIMMVPILEGVEKTHEDPSITNESLRMKYFGQADHVRLYAKQDFIQRLQSVGFIIELVDVKRFGTDVFEKNGISSKSVLYIVHRP